MNNIIVLVAGPKSEKKDTLAREVKAQYKDMIVLPADSPENVFQSRIKYDGNASIYTVLVADKEDFPVWHEVNDTADLACNTAESLADMLSEIDDMLNERNDELRQWMLTDSDCSQYMQIHSRSIYTGMQIIQLPNAEFGVAQMDIVFADYDNDEIQTILSFYDYTWEGLHHMLPDIDAMRIVAECIFESEALRNVCSTFSTYEEAVAEIERLKTKGATPFVRNSMALKNASKHQWTSYSDERELWLRPLDPISPADFEVVRATPSYMRYGEWAFTHRFIHLSKYQLNNEFDARILNRDGNMDETTLEIAGVNHIMTDEDGKPDRLNDPKYILDYALLAAMIADDESGAQYMSEEQAMSLVDKIVGTDRW